MKKIDTTWKLLIAYIFVILLVAVAHPARAQMKVMYFNAAWNAGNDVTWVDELKEITTKKYVDIGTDKEAQGKYQIAVIPTIIIFKDGEEVKRFQADLSFKMAATREEVQEEIDNILMSDF